MIYEVSAKLKDVVGIVNDLVILEKESFEVMITEMKDQFVVEKAVLINLKDYRNDQSVSILKIRKGESTLLVISDTLHY